MVFSFHVVCSWVSLALAATFLFSFLFCHYCAFLLGLSWVLGCEYVCHTPLWGFFLGILLPYLSPRSFCPWCRLSSQSLEPSFSCSCAPSFLVPSLLWLWFDQFSWGFLRLPSGSCVSQEFPSFVVRCEDVLSAFRFFISCRLSCLSQVWRSILGFFLFCWCGVWCLLSSVLSFEGCQLSSWLWEVLFSCLRLCPFAFSLLSFVLYLLRVVRTNLWSSFFR